MIYKEDPGQVFVGRGCNLEYVSQTSLMQLSCSSLCALVSLYLNGCINAEAANV